VGAPHYIESFRGKFREECLNEHWFLPLDDAWETIEDWRLDYNRVRPHSSLGYLTPEEFRMGYATVESKKGFPHSHSPDGGGILSLLNSTASALTYPD
jgi:putative transposase